MIPVKSWLSFASDADALSLSCINLIFVRLIWQTFAKVLISDIILNLIQKEEEKKKNPDEIAAF